jgi:hypothetical protein
VPALKPVQLFIVHGAGDETYCHNKMKISGNFLEGLELIRLCKGRCVG